MRDQDASDHPTPEDRKWLEELVSKANAGDRDAIRELRRFLDENPDFWRKAGDLAWHAETAWTELIARGDALAAESIRRESDRLRRELAGESTSPVVKLLVDRVVVLNLEVQHLQVLSAESGGTVGQTRLRLGRLESSQRRMDRALESLCRVRKLASDAGIRPCLRVVDAG
jgi:hypothetical protein